ncbi:hypothetical protein [Streptacidiphilus sp. MAP5-52]|uniref:hypothetical protein n=1 Tax=Streptacidiphilus sp. MAP5-52 TaxID=3156267 RepID=UPI003513DF35
MNGQLMGGVSATDPAAVPALPWPPAGGWVQIKSVPNETTGKFVTLPAEISRGDLDWLCRS